MNPERLQILLEQMAIAESKGFKWRIESQDTFYTIFILGTDGSQFSEWSHPKGKGWVDMSIYAFDFLFVAIERTEEYCKQINHTLFNFNNGDFWAIPEGQTEPVKIKAPNVGHIY